MSIKSEDSVLDRVTLEVRYPPAYEHYDRCGAIWSWAAARWSDLRESQVEPAQTSFYIGDWMSLHAGVHKAFATLHRPNADQLTEVPAFIAHALTTLNVGLYTRIGTRAMFFHEMKSREEAADLARQIAGARLLANSEGELLTEAKTVQRFEQGDFGHTITVASIQEQTKLELSPAASRLIGREVVGSRTGLVVDIDKFTLADVTPDQISWAEYFIETVDELRSMEERIHHV